jgi:nucleotide-binding universal stress UspA family protein
VSENLNDVTFEMGESHPDLTVNTRVVEGRPVKIIVEVAEEDFNLTFMGSQVFGLIAG